MNTPDLLSSFEYDNKTTSVEWFDIPRGSEIPDLPWKQIYAICDLDGKVPLVFYANSITNLPGGTVEPSETVDETIRRELEEEINCRVISWQPIGYQKLTEPGNPEPNYQLRLHAVVEKIGEFENDPGGSVIGYKLVELDEVNHHINYGNVGERMIQLVKSLS